MASSTDSAGGDSYIENAGPGIRPLAELPAGDRDQRQQQLPAGAAAAAAIDAELAGGWEEEAMGEILTGLGEIAHAIGGVGEDDWLMTEQDLKRIKAPLTRIANRYEPWRRLGAAADPIVVTLGTVRYTARSLRTRRAVLRRRQMEAEGRPGYQPQSAQAQQAAAAAAGDVVDGHAFDGDPDADEIPVLHQDPDYVPIGQRARR